MPLFAGAAKAIVTPPVGYRMGEWGLRKGRSKGVYRNLYSRAVVISDGFSKLAIVSVDVCGFPEEISYQIHSLIEEITGIPPENVLLSSTHNHTSPDFLRSVPTELAHYGQVFVDIVAGSVYEASMNVEPATMGYGTGDLPGWTVNRQYSERAVDTEVGVMVLNNVDGTPVARVVNFACHGVCDGGQYLEWSGDFSGEMSAFIEAAEMPAVALFIQGAGGNVHPFDWWFGNLDSRHMHTHNDTRLLGEALATEALRVGSRCELSSEIRLQSCVEDILLPRRQVSWTLGDAQALRDSKSKLTNQYIEDVWPIGTTTANSAIRHPELYGNGNNEVSLASSQRKPPVKVSVQALRLGDLVISAVPGELFNELGLEIKDSRIELLWCAAYCRGYIGYISTEGPYDEIKDVSVCDIVDMTRYRRFYGTTTSPFAPEAGAVLVSAAKRLIQEVS